MANGVTFKDFSFDVNAKLDTTSIAWLHTWASEIASQAQRNCQMDDDTGKQLKGSYSSIVNEGKGEAQIGSPLEAAYWEEFGTGTYADTSKNGGREGRKDWWVYVKDQGPRAKESTHYNSKAEAEAVAASMRAQGFDAYATNGREPNYTLEKAFTKTKPKAIADLNNQLRRELE